MKRLQKDSCEIELAIVIAALRDGRIKPAEIRHAESVIENGEKESLVEALELDITLSEAELSDLRREALELVKSLKRDEADDYSRSDDSKTELTKIKSKKELDYYASVKQTPAPQPVLLNKAASESPQPVGKFDETLSHFRYVDDIVRSYTGFLGIIPLTIIACLLGYAIYLLGNNIDTLLAMLPEKQKPEEVIERPAENGDANASQDSDNVNPVDRNAESGESNVGVGVKEAATDPLLDSNPQGSPNEPILDTEVRPIGDPLLMKNADAEDSEANSEDPWATNQLESNRQEFTLWTDIERLLKSRDFPRAIFRIQSFQRNVDEVKTQDNTRDATSLLAALMIAEQETTSMVDAFDVLKREVRSAYSDTDRELVLLTWMLRASKAERQMANEELQTTMTDTEPVVLWLRIMEQERSDSIKKASRRLVDMYPESVAAAFFHGIEEFLMGDNDAAQKSLAAAQTLLGEQVEKADSDWRIWMRSEAQEVLEEKIRALIDKINAP